LQTLSHRHEQLIPSLMSESIVDRLEIVQVYEKHTDGLSLT
jgi:hypothetical protein